MRWERMFSGNEGENSRFWFGLYGMNIGRWCWGDVGEDKSNKMVLVVALEGHDGIIDVWWCLSLLIWGEVTEDNVIWEEKWEDVVELMVGKGFEIIWWKGKLDSSKKTYLEMYNLFMVRSKHLYPLWLNVTQKHI